MEANGSGTDDAIKLKLKAKTGEVFEVSKSVVSCVKFVTGMLEGKLSQIITLFVLCTVI